MLKHIVSLYTLFWVREVAIGSRPRPRTYRGLENEECAGAGVPSAPPGDAAGREVSSELAKIRRQDILACVDMKGIFLRRGPSWSTG